MAPDEAQPALPRRRLLAFYVFLAAVVVAGVSLSIAAGGDEEAQPSIAGGYKLAENECLGSGFNLLQSGQFVSLENPEESLGGALRFRDGRLTGDVDCVQGGSKELDATIHGASISGTIGEDRFETTEKDDPPEPGARKPQVPDSVAGDYKTEPQSECLGGSFKLEGDTAIDLVAEDTTLGKLKYQEGKLTGPINCLDGDEYLLTGTAADRELDLDLKPKDGTAPPST